MQAGHCGVGNGHAFCVVTAPCEGRNIPQFSLGLSSVCMEWGRGRGMENIVRGIEIVTIVMFWDEKRKVRFLKKQI